MNERFHRVLNVPIEVWIRANEISSINAFHDLFDFGGADRAKTFHFFYECDVWGFGIHCGMVLWLCRELHLVKETKCFS